MTGEVLQAFQLNGSDADVRVPALPTLNVGTSNGFTVETWIYPYDSANRPIVEWNSDNNGWTSYGSHFWTSQPTPYGSGPGCLYANLIDTGGGSHYFASPAGIVTNGGWQHVALTYNHTTGYGCLYLNGSLMTSNSVGTFTPQTSYDLYFGARVCGAGAARWYGGIDEVSLYGGVLSGPQILAIYNAGSAGKCTGPDILIPPDAQSVTAGANVTFSVGATSATPMSYQWTLNGSNIPGATSSIYAINNVQSSQAGAYAVVISNSSGSSTSPSATLAVGSFSVWVSQPTGNCNIP